MQTQLPCVAEFPDHPVEEEASGEVDISKNYLKNQLVEFDPDTQSNSGMPMPEEKQSEQVVDKLEDTQPEVITEKDILGTINDSTYTACIYVVPLEDGRLYLGTAQTKDLKEQIAQLPYKTASTPIVLPKRSKLDVGKYWYILAKQYGQESVVTANVSDQIFYKRAFENTDSKEDSKLPKKKKLIFKKKVTQPTPGFFGKIQNVVDTCKRLIASKWPFIWKR